MNVTAKSKWKSVPLDAQLLARGFSEGLLGIEELSSYDLVQVKKKKSGSTTSGKITKVEDSKIVSKAKKRPLNEANSKTDDGEEIPKKKKKTRQKRKPKKKNKKSTPTNDSDNMLEPSQESKTVISDDVIVQLPGWKDYNVPKPVLKALKELNFEEPTPIQRETMPAALNGHADIVGAAETGSGKTLAFAIPIIHGILADRQNDESSVTNDDDSSLQGVPLISDDFYPGP